MGEISKNLVLMLAIAVIIVSSLGTWVVLNAAAQTFGGSQIPLSSSQSESNSGVVLVNVVDSEPPVHSSGPVSGMISVNVVE